jgi:structure-specific recognition protein 1
VYQPVQFLWLTCPSEILETKYEGKLEKSHDGPAHQVVANVFRGLVQKNIARPSPTFAAQSVIRGHLDHTEMLTHLQEPRPQPSGQMQYESRAGRTLLPRKEHLLPVKAAVSRQLQRCLQRRLHTVRIFNPRFITSHPKLFTRLGGGMASAKTLDLRIEPKAGSDVTFSSIGKNEKEYIEEFLAAKKVRVKTEAVDEAMAVDLGSDDEEMQSVASSEDEAPKIRTVGADDDESSEGEWHLYVCQNTFLTDLVSCR